MAAVLSRHPSVSRLELAALIHVGMTTVAIHHGQRYWLPSHECFPNAMDYRTEPYLLKVQSSSCYGRTYTVRVLKGVPNGKRIDLQIVLFKNRLDCRLVTLGIPCILIVCSEIALVVVSSRRKLPGQSFCFTHKCKVNFSSGATPIYRTRVSNAPQASDPLSLQTTAFERRHTAEKDQAPPTAKLPNVNVHSPTSEFYTTCTPPKVYKRSAIPQNGGNLNFRHIAYRSVSLSLLNPYLLKHQRAFGRYHTGALRSYRAFIILQTTRSTEAQSYLNLEGVNLAMATSYWLPTVNMLPSLVELHLPSCRLTMLPLTLPSINFTSLLVLDLSKNKFTSTIPPWLFNLTELEMLDLTNNNLTGKLLDSLGYLKSLRYLDLSYNSFQGSIPKSIGNLTSLEEFDLAWNQMSGIILESLGEFSSLVSLDIYGNTWEGAITEPHFAKLGGLRRVSIENNSPNISLVFNISSDWIPPFKLRSLYIHANWTELTTLTINNARISDTIPDWFSQLDLQLDYLDVSYNQLSGTLLFLKILRLRSNSFTRSTPLQLCGLFALHILDFSHNNLSGNIPHCIGNLSGLKSEFTNKETEVYGHEGRLEVVSKGRVLEYDSILYLVNSIDLSDNNLSGEMSVGITSLIKLGTLNLSMNHLKYPSKYGKLGSMVSVTFLNHLNLSYNNLSGKIPTGNQFQTFVDPSIYEGNASLSRCPLPIGCQDNKEAPQIPSGDGGEDDDSKLEKLQFIISMVIGFCAGFWGVFRTFAMKRF
ncbi:hypothetical protein PRUPE_7G034600 [Prunus persica]|uniref:Disease resistance R13L4/SHOC-2-like LRR domain-containing protein n=1 Tax=Prunus persica TaxID=3760 RepID=A0A251N9B7_PRUPE|nr:hypothetical protein PRUPE_7G034600 [Prunus persica]